MLKGRQLVFSYQGLAEALAKQHGFRAGPWRPNAEFETWAARAINAPGVDLLTRHRSSRRTTTQGYDEEASGLAGDAAAAMSAHE